MTLDMRPMLRGEVTKIPLDFQLEPEQLSDTTVVFPENARLVGEIVNTAGYMRLSLTAILPYTGVCARCLAPISDVFRLQIERTAVVEGTLTEEQLEDNVDEYVIIEHGELNLDEELREALILAFPMRLLCTEDCPGLCPKCGKPLRDGPCDCPKKERDPRFAVLDKLLDKQNEQ